MFRLVGLSRAIREFAPAELAPVFWLVTAFGSPKILFAGLAVLYWNTDRYRDAVLRILAATFVAIAVTVALKYWFALPRPPASVRRYPIEPSPVGFPSGHAITATVVYGGALLVLERHLDARSVGGVVAAVTVIGLSRVILGVHYLGDVLAGVAVGVVVLAAVWVVFGTSARVLFAGAALVAVPALAVTDVNLDSMLILGGSLGGFAATLTDRHGVLESVRERAVYTVPGMAVVGGGLTVSEFAEAAVPVALAAPLSFLAVFGVVAFPALFDGDASPGPRTDAN